jgi:hypothetical protein
MNHQKNTMLCFPENQKFVPKKNFILFCQNSIIVFHCFCKNKMKIFIHFIVPQIQKFHHQNFAKYDFLFNQTNKNCFFALCQINCSENFPQ